MLTTVTMFFKPENPQKPPCGGLSYHQRKPRVVGEGAFIRIRSFRTLTLLFAFICGLLTTHDAGAEAIQWQALSDDPGRFQSGWVFVPAKRPGADKLPESAVIEGGSVRLPDSVGPADLGFASDILASGSEAFWKHGGVALVMMEVPEAGARKLRLGLPRGASVWLDGREIFTAQTHLHLPESAEVAVTLEAGTHVLAVKLPRRKSGWHGRGFHLRWLTADGVPDPSLVFKLPWLNNSGAAFEAGIVRAKATLALSSTAPAWNAQVTISPTLPAALVSQKVALRAVPGRRSAAPTVALGDCTLTPGTICRLAADWPAQALESKSRGGLGPVVFEAQLGAQGAWHRVGQWGDAKPLGETTLADLKLAVQVRTALEGAGWLSAESHDLIRYDLQRLTDRLQLRPLKPPIGPKALRRRLGRHLKDLQAQRDPLQDAVGMHLRAYRSPLDGRYQPYALFVPPGLNPGKPIPMVVALHGFRGTPERICRIALGGAAPRMLVLCPYGYGDTVFRGVGEDDVFRTMALVEDRFAVDPDRVYLTGVSNGGLAAYEIALHHPDRWAAVAILAALGDLRNFSRIGREGHEPYETAWIDRLSSAERLSNARGMTFMIVYGEKDRLDHKHVEALSHKLRRAGARVRYIVHDDLGHNVWDRTYEKGAIFKWFRAHRRRHKGKRIDYISRSPLRRGAQGLYIERADWAQAPRITVRWDSSQELDVTATDAAEAFFVRLKPTEAARTVLLTLNDKPTQLTVEPHHQRLAFERAEQGWAVQAQTEAAPQQPWPQTQGWPRAEDFYGGLERLRNGPQLYVYGTHNPHDTALNCYLAHLDQRRWSRWSTLVTEVIPDTALTVDRMERHHLVLVGTDLANPWAGRLVPQTRAELRQPVASERTDVGMRIMVPNPMAPGLGVVLSTGTTARGVVFSSGLPEIVPDAVWAGEEIVAPPFDLRLRDRALLKWR